MIGRMFSMYGTWSSFETSNLMRDMTQGTIGEVAGRVARSAAATALIAYAAKHIGMNLGAWYMMPGSNFFDKEAPILPTLQAVGGPVYQEAEDLDEYLRSGEYGRGQLWPQLARSFPVNPRTGAVEIRHLWLPGSFAADAMWRAYTAAKQGDYKSAALQATGLKPPYNPDTFRGGGFRQF